MNPLKTLSIGRRLALAFVAVLALTCLVGAFPINRIAQVNAATGELAGKWLVSMRAMGEYSATMSAIRRGEIMHVMSASADERTAQERRIQAVRAKADQMSRVVAAFQLGH